MASKSKIFSGVWDKEHRRPDRGVAKRETGLLPLRTDRTSYNSCLKSDRDGTITSKWREYHSPSDTVCLCMFECFCPNSKPACTSLRWQIFEVQRQEKKIWKQIPQVLWTIPWIFRTIPLSSLSSEVCTGLHRQSSLTAMIVGSCCDFRQSHVSYPTWSMTWQHI